MKLNRRHVVTASLAGLASSSLAPLSAKALSRQSLSSENERLYLDACNTPHEAYHAEMIADVIKMMEKEQVETSRQNVRKVLTSVSCPLCGCNLDKAES